ncbi:WD40 repeat domain-containing protein [Kitasatospora purpeofusca]|uniref:WD40 repeat domain-containing protein n=1 Tax=Kitasatospora purpeofusca TaxID=67352 RepID=UPI0035E2D526
MVSDADTGDPVEVAGLPRHPAPVPLALARDGSHLLVRTGPEDRPDRDLVLLRLATGEKRVFDADADGLVHQAALSPDGRSMATLTDEDCVRVDVTDLGTGARKPLWSTEGWRSDAGLAWSPDGALLAVGCIDEEEDRTDTVVLSLADGSVLARYEGLTALSSPNGAWTGERELLLVEEFPDESVPPLFLHDVATGRVRRFDRVPGQVGGVSAVADGRLVQQLPGGLFGCALDGTDPRLVLGLPPTYEVGFFDVSEVF